MDGLYEGLSAQLDKDLLRFLTCGSVDDGKSTLIGRLLYDCSMILDDQLATLEQASRRFGTTGDSIDFSLVLDGLEDERQQRITIDVAYRFFTTRERAFVVADTPGHEQYTRNMATGASTSDLAVILVDARKSVLPQTKRHAFICSLLGIRHLVLAVNKMDLVAFDERCFEEIATGFSEFAAGLGSASIRAIPLSARYGDNVTRRSARMPWYRGPTLVEYLHSVEVSGGASELPFRFPVQWVNRPNAEFRGFSGRIVSGAIAPGDELIVAGLGRSARVKEIMTYEGALDGAQAGAAVTLTFDSEIDIARGDILADPREPPEFVDQFAAHVVWMSDQPLVPGRSYLLKIGTRTLPATVTALRHRIDVNTLAHLADKTLGLNEIGFCNLSTSAPVAFDAYAVNRDTGAFILIDRFTNETRDDRLRAAARQQHSLAGTDGWSETAGGIEGTDRRDPLVDRTFGRREINDRRCHRKEITRFGPAHDAARRRQCAARAQPRSRFYRHRPGRKHPTRRRGRQSDDRGRADRDLLIHIAVPCRAPDGARDDRPDRVPRDLCQHTARGMHPE